MGIVVVVDDLGDAAVELLGELEIDELVGSMSVGLRAKNTSDAELRVREELSKHTNERDGTTLTVVTGGLSKVSFRGSLERVSSPVRESRSVPAGTGLIAVERDLGSIRRVLLEDLLESGSTSGGVDSRRDTDGQLDGSVRTQDVTSVVQIRDTFNSNDAKGGSPSAANDLILDRSNDGGGSLEEGHRLGHGISERRSAGLGLSDADGRDLNLELGNLDLSSVNVLNAIQKLTDDTEGRSSDSRTLTRVDTLAENVDTQNSGDETTEGGGEPHVLVVGATRVEADNKIGDLDAGGQLLNVEGQIRRSRFLAGLDQDQATSMGELLTVQVGDSGDRTKDGISIIGSSTTVELVSADDGLIRRKSLTPREHGGLLIQVTVHQDGAVNWKDDLGRSMPLDRDRTGVWFQLGNWSIRNIAILKIDWKIPNSNENLNVWVNSRRVPFK